MISAELIYRISGSIISQIGRLIIGRNISFRLVSLISMRASLRTIGRGKIRYGERIEIRPNTEITARNGDIIIGRNCFVNRNCMIVAHELIKIDDRVTIGPGTVIYDHDHASNGKYKTAAIRIEKNVWIGANCIILKGVTIGENSIIAAGTTITKDVPPNVIVREKKNLLFKEKK